MLIFDLDQQTKPVGALCATTVAGCDAEALADVPEAQRRQSDLGIPEVSELQVVRHFTMLSRKNFSIDTHFYPLGSCTMKYNPRIAHKVAMLPGFAERHPLAAMVNSQGFLETMYELQAIIQAVTGMSAVSLTPMAGAQGEFAGLRMIRAYHEARGDRERTEIVVPTTAHGTNPATAVMCGYRVVEVPVLADGDVDVDAMSAVIGPRTAGLMLTNPSTCGTFERRIQEIAARVHAVGGLLYYDGANLNAIMGKARPGDMGFDVIHVNLHKTFATPHGGGGPGSGPVGVAASLQPFLPGPIVVRDAATNGYRFSTAEELPQSIGRLSTFMGNAGVLLRAYAYARLLGGAGVRRVGEFATLNANYLMKKLADLGIELAYPTRRASHEFIVTFRKSAKRHGITAMDLAKRLLDYGIHAPTTYFPLLVPECWLIEPTETESLDTLDRFVEVMVQILREMEATPDLVKGAPHHLPVGRLDDVKAARDLDIALV
ncbi:MAG: aminomethyl-transferring glycine dehydrogenase subunit GcvPB [Gammaproteobacteria bacterium]